MNKWIGTGKVIKDPTIRYKEDKASFVAFVSYRITCNNGNQRTLINS